MKYNSGFFAMKSYKLLFLLFFVTNINYSMDNRNIGKIKKWKLEVFYTCHYNDLNNETKIFIDKFNMWPQEEKSKIQIIKKNNVPEYMVIYNSIIVSKYNGPIIDHLNYHLENDKIIQFKWVIEYLKKYQYPTQPKNRTICTMFRPF